MGSGNKKEFNRAVIKTGYLCNSDCRFCDCRSLREYSSLSLKEIGAKVLLAKKQRYEMVIFSGGEVTLRDDLAKLVALCRKVGIKCGLQSNGVLLSDRQYTQNLVKQGLSFVQLTLLSHQKETHNSLTNSDSFNKVLTTLSILHELEVKTVVNCVVTSENMNDLVPLAEMLVKYAPVTFKADLLNPVDIEQDDIKLIPSIKTAGEKVIELINWHQNLKPIPEDFAVKFSAFPLCTVSIHADKSHDLKQNNNSDISEVYESGFSRREFLGFVKPDACNQCRHIENCPGVYESYIPLGAEADLTPETGPISNSFSYEPERELTDFDIANCPIKSGSMQTGEYERQIILYKDENYSLYRTDSADFTADVFVTTKHKYGQIYLDVSGKVFHEDFEHDMVKVDPHPICIKCTKFMECAAVYQPVEINVFTKAENDLRKHILDLKGKILDVGGGPLMYAKELGNLVENGTIDYNVIEPDPNPSLVNFLDKYDLTSHYFKGKVENYHCANEEYDWILVLRSHNHLFDLNKAYLQMAGWLKPGGKLLVVDNTIYGLLRSEEVWKEIRKHKGSDRFEHYNNHTTEDAIPFVTQAGLKLVDKQEVTPEGANQWWCLFEK